MNRSRVLSAAVLVAAACFSPVGQVLGQPPAAAAGAEFAGPTNAALVYWRCWEILPTGLLDTVKEAYSKDAAWKPDAALSKALEEAQGAIQKIVRASRLPEGDWGLEYSDGVGMLLPHLSKMRSTARVLLADARRLEAAGRRDDAAERIAACLRMTRHLRHDRTLISTLVSQAIGVAGVGELDVLAAGGLSPSEKAEIRAAAASLGTNDPFGYEAALDAERRLYLEAVVKELTGPRGGEGTFARLGMVEEDPESKAAVAVLERMSPEQVSEEAARMRAMYDEIIRTLARPDADPQAAALLGKIEQGQAGLLAKVMMPNVRKIRESYAKGRAELARAADLVK